GDSTPYSLLKNVHWNASVIVDENITIRDLCLEYGAFSLPVVGGGKHLLAMWFARNIKVRDCLFKVAGGENATTMFNCDDTTIDGCTAYDFANCAYDHWNNPTSGSVINCYAQSASTVQFVNWNPEATAGPPGVSKRFIMANNRLVFTGAGNAAGCFLEPLGATTSATDV